jgi:hypothetical protein
MLVGVEAEIDKHKREVQAKKKRSADKKAIAAAKVKGWPKIESRRDLPRFQPWRRG